MKVNPHNQIGGFMPRLFNENGYFTTEGMELLQEISAVIRPIFSKYKDKGFEVREISHTAGFAVHDTENILCLKDMYKRSTEKKNDISK